MLELPGIRKAVEAGSEKILLRNVTKNEEYGMLMPLTERQKQMILAGGLICYTRSKA